MRKKELNQNMIKMKIALTFLSILFISCKHTELENRYNDWYNISKYYLQKQITITKSRLDSIVLNNHLESLEIDYNQKLSDSRYHFLKSYLNKKGISYPFYVVEYELSAESTILATAVIDFSSGDASVYVYSDQKKENNLEKIDFIIDQNQFIRKLDSTATNKDQFQIFYTDFYYTITKFSKEDLNVRYFYPSPNTYKDDIFYKLFSKINKRSLASH